MADIFRILTESKIREWQDRPASERSIAKSSEFQTTASFERPLLDEIQGLVIEVGKSGPKQAEANLSTAKNLEIQLMASLEKQGLNLTAKDMAERLRLLRKEHEG